MIFKKLLYRDPTTSVLYSSLVDRALQQLFPLPKKFKLPALSRRHPSRLPSENYVSMAAYPAGTLTWKMWDLRSSLYAEAYRDIFILISYPLGVGVAKEDTDTAFERKEALLHPFQYLLMLSLRAGFWEHLEDLSHLES